MKLIALLIGLLIERLATRLFHLRELGWLDHLIDAGFHWAGRVSKWPPLIPIILLLLLLVLPVFLVILLLGDTLFGFPHLLLSIVVLFFSLGPKDIGEEVDDYCSAAAAGDSERIHKTAKALLEHDVPEDAWQRIERVEQAVFVQANNRLFAVIFWFIVFGPLGAWAYRVIDLIRRRAVIRAGQEEQQEPPADKDHSTLMEAAASSLHSWVAWIPARLTALGYALAGSFDNAISAWRHAPAYNAVTVGGSSEQLLARVGVAALGLVPVEDENQSSRAIRGAGAANRLVFRLLLLWAVVIAGLTLYGWSV